MKKKLGFIILICIVSVAMIIIGKGIQKTDNAKLDINNSNAKQVIAQTPEANQNTVPNNEVDKVKNNENNSTGESNSPIKDTNKNNDQTINNITKNTSTNKTETSVSSNAIVQEKQVQQPNANIKIVDTITGKTIIAKYEELSGITAAEATCKLLDNANISYKISGFGDTLYFSSINGLRERGDGPLSGWCFYINGKKPSIGAGVYKLNKDDILEWKYLKDGSSTN